MKLADTKTFLEVEVQIVVRPWHTSRTGSNGHVTEVTETFNLQPLEHSIVHKSLLDQYNTNSLVTLFIIKKTHFIYLTSMATILLKGQTMIKSGLVASV